MDWHAALNRCLFRECPLRVTVQVRALPKLRILVMGLLKSLSSIAYIGLLLMLSFYLYVPAPSSECVCASSCIAYAPASAQIRGAWSVRVRQE